MTIENKRDVLDLPFVTNEQKFEFWQQAKAEIKGFRERQSQAQDWQLVPKQPTAEMYLVGQENSHKCATDIYKAMLAAAPKEIN